MQLNRALRYPTRRAHPPPTPSLLQFIVKVTWQLGARACAKIASGYARIAQQITADSKFQDKPAVVCRDCKSGCKLSLKHATAEYIP